MLVAAAVEVPEVVGEAKQKTQLFDAEVGAGEWWLPATSVGRLDEGFQNVEGGALDTVAEEEALSAGKRSRVGTSQRTKR